MWRARSQKVYDRVNDEYGAILPPSDHQRRIHLGRRGECTLTDEGVKALELPYQCDELQEISDKIQRRVTVFSDPDCVNEITILVKGYPEPFLGRLSLTTSKDMSAVEAINRIAKMRVEDASDTHDFEARLARVRGGRFDHMAAVALENHLPCSYTTFAEATATLVVGPSHIGKTFEVDHQRKLFNEGADEMPDDRPAKMVKVMLRGSSSWKELGVLTLRSLGYKKVGRGAVNQTEIWNQVMFHAEANGVVAIHYDECRHIFIRRSAEIQNKIRGCFKSLLKQPEWLLMLIFSGVDELRPHITCEEQLGNLVKTVTFVEIDPGKEIDLSEMNSICFA